MKLQAPYVWFVLVAALDVMLTATILHLGGREANAIAEWIIHRFGLVGMVIYKFGLTIFVVLICETIARRDEKSARTLAYGAVAMSAIPVVVGLRVLTRL